MKAADNTSMLKTTKIRPSCAMTVGGGSQLISMRPHGRLDRPPVGRYRAAPFAHVRLELRAEMLDGRQRGSCGGIAERAERLADDVVPDAHQEIDVTHLSFAVVDARQNLVEPVSPFAARRALAARL